LLLARCDPCRAFLLLRFGIEAAVDRLQTFMKENNLLALGGTEKNRPDDE
jgi:hypothetical protein